MNEIFLLIIVCCCLVAAYDVQRLRAENESYKQEFKQHVEVYNLIHNVINYSFDIERDNYIETYGEEENNYLYLDSDLDLHVEQEDNNHIYKTLHELNKLVNNWFVTGI